MECQVEIFEAGMDAARVGKAIAFLRKNSSMTQDALAEKIGVSAKAVSKWENGRGIPEISALARIASMFGIEVESLLAGNLIEFRHECVGVLFLDYSGGIYPDDLMFRLRCAEFQTSFFLLAGIRKLYLVGDGENLVRVRRFINDDRKLGMEIRCMLKDELEANRDNVVSANGAMAMKGLNFLFGKDLTRIFRNIMHDEGSVCRLVDFMGRDVGIIFYPGSVQWRDLLRGDAKTSFTLDRGIISFPIENQSDMLDAANLLCLIGKHQGEQVGCLEDIASRRNLLANGG